MSKVYVGRITSFHGIKGEIRIKSSFSYPKRAFLVNSFLIIDEKRYKIVSYRVHKNYHMIKLLGFDKIEDVEFLRNKKVYKEKSELNLSDDEILDEDLITYKVITTDGKEGIIKEIFYASYKNKILRIDIEGREVLVPVNTFFIKKINKNDKEILIELIEGM